MAKPYELFEVVERRRDVARVRSSFLFEIGEELAVRIERDGAVFETTARIRGTLGTVESRVTELELADRRRRGAW